MTESIKKHIVVLSGAGVSADSGVETFRDADGLWAKHRIEDVCTPEALERNPQLVLNFYNARRRQLKEVEPNPAHYAIASLEEYFDVDVVTQNVDNLHERAGSSKVLHLHGELTKCRSMKDESFVRDIGGDIKVGDLCPQGGQLRPHIVFFGEAVPNIEIAAQIVSTADIVIVIGTSLAVYPAAGLVNYAPSSALLYVVDPGDIRVFGKKIVHYKEKARDGMPALRDELVKMEF